VLLTDESMYNEHWWKNTNRGIPKYCEKKACPSATLSTTIAHEESWDQTLASTETDQQLTT
jgi:hypothetical protein